mgnify:FL=1
MRRCAIGTPEQTSQLSRRVLVMQKALIALVLVQSLWLASIPRASAEVNLSGTYNIATLTPVQRPKMYGENLYLTEVQAQKMADGFQQYAHQAGKDSDPNREAPPEGGKVGGYNAFWIDRGERAIALDGRFRTSLITHPSNGRIPPMNNTGAARMAKILADWRIIWRDPDPSVAEDGSSAWWLKGDGLGPYDDLEQRPLAERCIIGSRSTAGPPMLPNYYNNFKRIVQTEDHVMILTEMNHDARIVRMNAKHRQTGVQTWLGDSVGHWEGDTLIVQTKNFGPTPPLSGSDENLTVIERFSKTSTGELKYQFEVTDATVWDSTWGGEYPWVPSGDKVYEYACHEGNYALGNIMRGARLLEKEAAR